MSNANLEPVDRVSEQSNSLALSNMGGGFLPAPATVREAIEFAQCMAKAGPLVGAAFRGQPGACLAIYMQAGRLGMDPFALSTKAYLVNGNIAYEAQAVAAMVYSSPVLVGRLRFEYRGEGDDRMIIVTGRIKDDPVPAVYESPPLRVMREGGKSPLWKKDPDQQMAYYGTRAWARRHTPDVLMGVYSVDEAEEIGMRNVTPQDGAGDRLKMNLAKFEEDRNAGRKGLTMPDPEKVQDGEVEEPIEPEPDAYADFDDIEAALVGAQTEIEVSAIREAALACSWLDDARHGTLQKLVANRFDELEAEKEAV
ncbi:recombinase RecT [Henriciella mobilis]|uniref:recombinase RecT n=1 Tax=Henriciella mobilis TaxID=2305467 RepID=UPI00131497D3|nr:recombinase RecT [Henriciella mobilis]